MLDRYVAAVPDNGRDWLDHLAALTSQISASYRPIADHDLEDLAEALEIAQAAIASRTPWSHPRRRY